MSFLNMGIPIIGGLEAIVSSLNNASSISRLLSNFEFTKFLRSDEFWKWGAFILALVYASSRVAYKIKILIIQHLKAKSLASEPLVADSSDESCSAEEEDDDDGASSSCSSDEENYDAASSSHKNLTKLEEDFRVAGSSNFSQNEGHSRKFKLRRRRSFISNFSLSELLNRKSVVKLWDGLGLRVDPADCSDDTISIFDLNKNMEIGSILGKWSAVAPPSPAVIISAIPENDTKLGVNLWDTRIGRRTAAMSAEWRLKRPASTIAVNAGGIDKSYVRYNLSRNLIGDVRKMNSPMDNPANFDEDTR
ncbi:hypothetical protein Nepgr_003744 [Nepenthes gracilis]|uniref:Uncharacterized protein n=1 Tax=Nepenthes gracilis TaxID=150966 RepID=A0AAD3XEA1_NEPGR|nr:hypothetical protein Nepgr_003744 [Nepenthes gracilis]